MTQQEMALIMHITHAVTNTLVNSIQFGSVRINL